MPATVEATTAEKYVVLHMGVGEHVRGSVIPGARFGNAEAVQRLLDLKAIRPARPEEAVAQKVTVRDEHDRHVSYETMTLQKDREIDKLRLENNGLRAEVDQLRQALARPHAAAAQAEAVALLEKDAVIEDLQKQVRDLKQQLHEQSKGGTGQQHGHRGNR